MNHCQLRGETAPRLLMPFRRAVGRDPSLKMLAYLWALKTLPQFQCLSRQSTTKSIDNEINRQFLASPAMHGIPNFSKFMHRIPIFKMIGLFCKFWETSCIFFFFCKKILLIILAQTFKNFQEILKL